MIRLNWMGSSRCPRQNSASEGFRRLSQERRRGDRSLTRVVKDERERKALPGADLELVTTAEMPRERQSAARVRRQDNVRSIAMVAVRASQTTKESGVVFRQVRWSPGSRAAAQNCLSIGQSRRHSRRRCSRHQFHLLRRESKSLVDETGQPPFLNCAQLGTSKQRGP